MYDSSKLDLLWNTLDVPILRRGTTNFKASNTQYNSTINILESKKVTKSELTYTELNTSFTEWS